MRRRLSLLALAVALLGLLGLPSPSPAAPFFTDVVAFSTKTGFRTVVTWQAASPAVGIVRWGTSPTQLTNVTTVETGLPDRAQVAVIDGLKPGTTYWYQVEDRLTGQKSTPIAARAGNAYTNWNGKTYTINLLVQLDSPSLPDSIPGDQAVGDLARAVDVMAERVWDATDGFVRLGKVLVMDTNTDYAANVPFGPGVVCPPGGGVADALIETTLPFDSHTWTPWSIDSRCTMFYLGRQGQLLVSRWRDELHTGYVATHELSHYAFNAPDLYGGPDCWNPDWDGSLMHNTGGYNEDEGRWEGTELDRNEQLTPCEMGGEPYSWDQLRERYQNVPLRAAGPIQNIVDTKRVGNPDGGALEIYTLTRTPAGSKLSRFSAGPGN